MSRTRSFLWLYCWNVLLVFHRRSPELCLRSLPVSHPSFKSPRTWLDHSVLFASGCLLRLPINLMWLQPGLCEGGREGRPRPPGKVGRSPREESGLYLEGRGDPWKGFELGAGQSKPVCQPASQSPGWHVPCRGFQAAGF